MRRLLGIQSPVGAVSDAAWWRVIMLAWAAVLVAPQIVGLVPASWWFTVTSVRVDDAVVGADPVMHVEREIHRPFTAAWSAEVEQLLRSGGFVLVCRGAGESNYAVDNRLPDPLTLTWWVSPKCRLGPGQYRIATKWRLETGQTVNATSNTFEVMRAQ